jgi:hypothetical protein
MWLGMPPSMTTETNGEMNMRISDSTGRPAASRRDVLPDGPGVAVATSPVWRWPPQLS